MVDSADVSGTDHGDLAFDHPISGRVHGRVTLHLRHGLGVRLHARSTLRVALRSQICRLAWVVARKAMRVRRKHRGLQHGNSTNRPIGFKSHNLLTTLKLAHKITPNAVGLDGTHGAERLPHDGS